jgi:glucose/arabinose dehydrogenase
MFIAEKDGVVRVMDPDGGLEPNPVIDIRADVNTYIDRGLLGIAVDSDYANPAHRYLYLLYTHESDPGNYTGAKVSQLRRVVVNPDNSVGSQQVILGTYTTTPCPSPSNTLDCIPSDGDSHSIGTVRSDPDGSLWVGSGEAAPYHDVDPLAFRSYDERAAWRERSCTSTGTGAACQRIRSVRPTPTRRTCARSSTRRASATRSGSRCGRAGSDPPWATWDGTAGRSWT